MARRGYISKTPLALKLGLVAPDTEFNRRAADYAKKAMQLAAVQKHKAKKKNQKVQNSA